MKPNEHLSLRLNPDDTVLLRTTVETDSLELTLDRDDFKALFHHLIRLRAKLDLRDARGLIEDNDRHGRR